MVTVDTKTRRSNQDIDEQQAILSDLRNNPHHYLRHPDAQVRCWADWTMEAWGIRRLRGEMNLDKMTHLKNLWMRLRDIASGARLD